MISLTIFFFSLLLNLSQFFALPFREGSLYLKLFMSATKLIGDTSGQNENPNTNHMTGDLQNVRATYRLNEKNYLKWS
uniref:Uncharacterized protein n=1 Tax=Rhizophora mucronata TaxID=61149 RepID=A0A2P2QUF7_RHIMU